jgi:DNA processing protein
MSTPAATELSYEDLIDWIRLARSPGIGAKTFKQLLQRFGAAHEVIARQSDWGIRKQGDIPQPAVAEREFAAATKAGLHYLPFTDPRYPSRWPRWTIQRRCCWSKVISMRLPHP